MLKAERGILHADLEKIRGTPIRNDAMKILMQILKPFLEVLFNALFKFLSAPDEVLPDPIPELDSMVDTSYDSIMSSYGGLLTE